MPVEYKCQIRAISFYVLLWCSLIKFVLDIEHVLSLFAIDELFKESASRSIFVFVDNL